MTLRGGPFRVCCKLRRRIEVLSRQLLISGAGVLSALAKATDEGKAESAAAEKDWTQVQSLLLSLRTCTGNHVSSQILVSVRVR